MRSSRLQATVVATGAAAILAAGMAFAPAASADAFRCGSFGSDSRAMCAYVQSAPNGLTVRTGPSSQASPLYTLANGTKVEVDCWTTGSSVNGYNIWAKLYSPSGSRYVSDFYLSTGHIQSYVNHC
ncbi:SH3 domain-containing protein [Streptomyces europaeiscabiei]|uniref:SH3 domain-containing protein n=1 Tax=Streptomyces europaeiscabiei TaxID=146819 RepID=A0ABU4NXQ5_9ACTN|nr:SH3 domain-containing protein [Streptomyces europaeiscabiei]MDX2530764.1 SH3 domain-containing protein [Streptomyces europaeiscabiei]MDX2762155.1 SH3 domain-containing protein [Streptomyces europaeiscabiei]MDX2770109.1 SH3 domain-containing protein [Streptomyces europaeiscabiei]MDX3548689.1 SH3 domain-containing protein [Streptomyces europaeiscabiei]MDX3558102.1 SH3 domain-containing protein [Streptomyces europaeiscabiei]